MADETRQRLIDSMSGPNYTLADFLQGRGPNRLMDDPDRSMWWATPPNALAPSTQPAQPNSLMGLLGSAVRGDVMDPRRADSSWVPQAVSDYVDRAVGSVRDDLGHVATHPEDIIGAGGGGPLGAMRRAPMRIQNPIRAWHGSRIRFDDFDLQHAGSSEGLAQGRGIYLSDSPDVARSYMGGLSRGHLYDSDIHATPDQLIRWDDRFAMQPELVQRAIDDAFRQSGNQPFSTWTGNRGRASDQFRALENAIGGEEAARAMAERGVAGVVFPEYRGVNSYSIFSPNETVQIARRHDAPLPSMAEILRRYGIAAPIAGGAAASSLMGDRQQ